MLQKLNPLAICLASCFALFVGASAFAKVSVNNGIVFLQTEWVTAANYSFVGRYPVDHSSRINFVSLRPKSLYRLASDVVSVDRKTTVSRGILLTKMDQSGDIFCQLFRLHKQSNNRWKCFRDKNKDNIIDEVFDASAQGDAFFTAATVPKYKAVLGGFIEKIDDQTVTGSVTALIRRSATFGMKGKPSLRICVAYNNGTASPCLDSEIYVEEISHKVEIYGVPLTMSKTLDGDVSVVVHEGGSQNLTVEFLLPASRK